MNSSSGTDGLVNENNGNKRNPNSARSRGGNVSARGDQSARRKKDIQDNGGGEKRSGLGIVGSGMSVSGNRVRTIPRDQDKYHNSGGNSSRRSRGPTPRGGEAQSSGEKYYVPGRHDDTERRPSSLKNGGGSQTDN